MAGHSTPASRQRALSCPVPSKRRSEVMQKVDGGPHSVNISLPIRRARLRSPDGGMPRAVVRMSIDLAAHQPP
eukprot:CAMPEP_0181230276 /NCGR_PEP_ID=MMETSP1096-20121128/34381_1 /TAXON_ID=156174 ORGANISM="Chrysochromulina ericina, Strain CCMP281" /NCGR_SAMPLE_ID=MMETSP1096 /ASSEMBLY_ACC=CAM_ASM_000453 /LENGTH=72 /DNA_ID=CAMNT_0023324029 /DNA_START=71 /DNA_END=290 /DNA_ORIENTATION=+